MTYYSVIAVTPTSEEWIPEYVGAASELVVQHGGKFLARTSSHKQMEGQDQPAALRIIIEWPTEAAAKGFMADPAYAPHLKARTEGSESSHFLIEARDDVDASSNGE